MSAGADGAGVKSKMDTIGLYLKEAFKEPGCPICRVLEKFENEWIENVLYEHVNSPSVRKKFLESLGLCTYHAWKVRHVAASNPLYGPLGVGTIYEHMLRVYIESLEKGESVKRGKCHLCSLVEEKEKRTIEEVAQRFDYLIEAYEESEAILCNYHYDMLMERLRDRPELAGKLKEIHVRKLKNLHSTLRRYLDSFDYRSTYQPTKRDMESVPGSIEALKGRPIGINICRAETKRREKRFRFI